MHKSDVLLLGLTLLVLQGCGHRHVSTASEPIQASPLQEASALSTSTFLTILCVLAILFWILYMVVRRIGISAAEDSETRRASIESRFVTLRNQLASRYPGVGYETIIWDADRPDRCFTALMTPLQREGWAMNDIRFDQNLKENVSKFSQRIDEIEFDNIKSHVATGASSRGLTGLRYDPSAPERSLAQLRTKLVLSGQDQALKDINFARRNTQQTLTELRLQTAAAGNDGQRSRRSNMTSAESKVIRRHSDDATDVAGDVRSHSGSRVGAGLTPPAGNAPNPNPRRATHGTLFEASLRRESLRSFNARISQSSSQLAPESLSNSPSVSRRSLSRGNSPSPDRLQPMFDFAPPQKNGSKASDPLAGMSLSAFNQMMDRDSRGIASSVVDLGIPTKRHSAGHPKPASAPQQPDSWPQSVNKPEREPNDLLHEDEFVSESLPRPKRKLTAQQASAAASSLNALLLNLNDTYPMAELPTLQLDEKHPARSLMVLRNQLADAYPDLDFDAIEVSSSASEPEIATFFAAIQPGKVQRRTTPREIVARQEIESPEPKADEADEADDASAGQNYPDDLTKISGIGPVYETQLYANGVYTWWQIWKTSVKQLKGIANTIAAANVDAWPKQAKRLATKHDRVGIFYSGPQPSRLTEIKGISDSIERKLFKAEIVNFERLASCTVEEVQAAVDGKKKVTVREIKAWIKRASKRVAGK